MTKPGFYTVEDFRGPDCVGYLVSQAQSAGRLRLAYEIADAIRAAKIFHRVKAGLGHEGDLDINRCQGNDCFGNYPCKRCNARLQRAPYSVRGIPARTPMSPTKLAC